MMWVPLLHVDNDFTSHLCVININNNSTDSWTTSSDVGCQLDSSLDGHDPSDIFEIGGDSSADMICKDRCNSSMAVHWD
jgi:hypothetical protein